VRLWSSLSARTKRRYKSQGVTPSGYNAWQRKPAVERRRILKEYPSASGPAAAKKQREVKQSARAPRSRTVYPDITTSQVAAHAVTILPGGPKVKPIVAANSTLMESEERRVAYGSTYELWAARAADQTTRNNPWFYHSIIPAARR
jgi:hypothetical protein